MYGEPWPAIKVLSITGGDRTYVCVRRDGSETVTPVANVKAGLEMFVSELHAAIQELPVTDH